MLEFELKATMWALSGGNDKFYLTEPEPRKESVMSAVCSVFGISQKELISLSRKRYLAEARFVAMFFLRNHSDIPLIDIAIAVGKKNHSTVLHGLRQFEILKQTCRFFREKVDRVYLMLEGVQ